MHKSSFTTLQNRFEQTQRTDQHDMNQVGFTLWYFLIQGK